MQIIKTDDYIGDYMCAICLENFKENDQIYMIKHYNDNQKSEKIDMTRKRKHIFHVNCLNQYIDENEKRHSVHVHLCPIDRDRIHSLMPVKFHEIDALNIINFSRNYYELLDKYTSKDIINVSIIDKINVNYKDNNGKTLLYCACQRGNLRLVRQLIKLGASPTISDDNRFTPLMASISHNYIDIVKSLLKIPQIIEEINYIDHKGKSAIDYACEYHRFQCLNEILKVPNIDHHVLTKVLSEIKLSTSIQIPLIKEIKTKIKKYLGIQNLSQLEIKKFHIIPLPPPHKNSTYLRTTDDNQMVKVSNIDIDHDPELFDLVYVSPTKNFTNPHCEFSTIQNELSELKYYNQVDPDIIYKSYIN